MYQPRSLDIGDDFRGEFSKQTEATHRNSSKQIFFAIDRRIVSCTCNFVIQIMILNLLKFQVIPNLRVTESNHIIQREDLNFILKNSFSLYLQQF